jgi:hypothetical protein
MMDAAAARLRSCGQTCSSTAPHPRRRRVGFRCVPETPPAHRVSLACAVVTDEAGVDVAAKRHWLPACSSRCFRARRRCSLRGMVAPSRRRGTTCVAGPRAHGSRRTPRGSKPRAPRGFSTTLTPFLHPLLPAAAHAAQRRACSRDGPPAVAVGRRAGGAGGRRRRAARQLHADAEPDAAGVPDVLYEPRGDGRQPGCAGARSAAQPTLRNTFYALPAKRATLPARAAPGRCRAGALGTCARARGGADAARRRRRCAAQATSTPLTARGSRTSRASASTVRTQRWRRVPARSGCRARGLGWRGRGRVRGQSACSTPL